MQSWGLRFPAPARSVAEGLAWPRPDPENLLNQIAHLHQMTVAMLLPGIAMSATPDDWEKIGGGVEGWERGLWSNMGPKSSRESNRSARRCIYSFDGAHSPL